MERTPTTPHGGVEERRCRADQDRPSGTADKEISGKVVVESPTSQPPGTIGLEQAREILDDPTFTDEQVEEIKEQVRLLVEVIYEKWLVDRGQSNGSE